MEVLRIGAMALDDYLPEFWSDLESQAISMVPGLFGTWMGPKSPTSVATWLLHEILRGREVVGGPAALSDALVSAAPEVRCGVRVQRIEVQKGRVTGVLLDDGEQLSADAVVSTLGPRRTMLELIHLRQVPPKVARDVRRIRVRGIHAKVHMVVKEPLFPHARVRLGESPNALERAYDDARHKRMPRRPTLDIRQVGNVVSIWAYGATHELRGGWNDDARDALGRAVRARLEEATGDLSSRVEATEVLTPADLEAQYGLEGGHVLHGEMGLDQLLGSCGPRRACRTATAASRGLCWVATGRTPVCR